MMNFIEICQLAETTRDDVYGLRVGSDRFNHDAICFVSDIKSTAKEEVESPYRKGKREKAENIARYRCQMMANGKFSFERAAHTKPMAQHRSEMAFVAMAVKNGLCENITEDDLLDQ
jgi:hypothetical protein